MLMSVKHTALSIAFLVVWSTGLIAEPKVVKVFPNGLPADAVKLPEDRIAKLKAANTDERIAYVAEPTLTLYPAPKDVATGCGVVICPGGGYNILAWNKEGIELAQWFNKIGVSAAVLKYRVPRRTPDIHHEPLQDVQRAIRLFRSMADEMRVDVNRVGVLGFSAGGHLTVMSGTKYDELAYPKSDAIDEISARPNFICPIYCAYLGNNYSDNKPELGDLVKITKETPPAFLAVTFDDVHRGVQSALLVAEYKKAGVPAEAHIYAKGGHGYGIRPTGNPVETWHHRLAEWLESSGWLTK
ncbi:MAG TPA: xylanase [Planctomycetaceae bacterium]|jgi:acetyl esterase/lipase|nr:xylanase [Planctomycetaceae bacterium]HCP84046.1 xylanase [Planctomycetaceae bacterium]|tara:strand:- start:3990 stop:4886 length:897 start_codon:yes stop_codon:yes gene_type:complete